MSKFSKETDALALTGHAYLMAELPDINSRDAIKSGVHHMRQQTPQHLEAGLSEEAERNLWAGEIFLNLGRIASEKFLGKDNYLVSFSGNPVWDLKQEAFSELSPFKGEERFSFALPPGFPPPRDISSETYKDTVDVVLSLAPDAHKEFQGKWESALAINGRRGRVALKAWNSTELFGDRPASQISTHTAEFPYYATLNERNAVEILNNALEDLQELSRSL